MDTDFIEKNIDDAEEFIWDIISKYNVDKYRAIDMEDLFQEGWLALKKAECTDDSPELANFHTYAYRVIDNKIQDVLDKHARTSSREFSYAPYENDDDEEAVPLVEKLPDTSGLTVEQKARLDIAMSTLDIEDEKMLRLASEGYSQEEIADEVGISQQTVSNHLIDSREVVRETY